MVWKVCGYFICNGKQQQINEFYTKKKNWNKKFELQDTSLPDPRLIPVFPGMGLHPRPTPSHCGLDLNASLVKLEDINVYYCMKKYIYSYSVWWNQHPESEKNECTHISGYKKHFDFLHKAIFSKSFYMLTLRSRIVNWLHNLLLRHVNYCVCHYALLKISYFLFLPIYSTTFRHLVFLYNVL